MVTRYPAGSMGIDWNDDKLRFIHRHLPRLIHGDGTALPLASGSASTVVCSQVLEHIPDDGEALLDELVRVLKPGGRLVLGTPDYGRWQWRLIERVYSWIVPMPYTRDHVTHYDFDRLQEALEARGLRVLDHAYIGGAELIVLCEKDGAS